MLQKHYNIINQRTKTKKQCYKFADHHTNTQISIVIYITTL